MERLSILLTALAFFSVIFLLDIKFNYKDKLVNILGIVKYKIILFSLLFIIFYTLLFKYDIYIFESPIGATAFMSYIYLASVLSNKHQK